MPARLNEASEITIPLRNLIAIVAFTGVAVMGYFQITERLNFLEHNYDLLLMSVEANSEFRTLWPRGELGALPDDAEQNMRLRYLEKDIEVIEAHVDTLRVRSIKQEELHNPPHPFAPVIKTEAHSD